MPPRRNATAEAIERNNVLMEDLTSKFQVVIEAVGAMKDDIASIKSTLTQVQQRLSALELRVEVLETIVRQNHEETHVELAVIKRDVAALKSEVSRRDERARIDALEKRVTKLETKRG